MSRSRKRAPVTGTTTARSEKTFKRAEHQKERHQVRQALREGCDGDDPLLNDGRLFGDPWVGPKDGKQWWGDGPHLNDFDPRQK